MLPLPKSMLTKDGRTAKDGANAFSVQRQAAEIWPMWHVVNARAICRPHFYRIIIC